MAEPTPIPPPTNGNGQKRLQQLDVIIGCLTGIAILGVIGINVAGAYWHAEGALWSMLNESKTFLAGMADKAMLGYFALAAPRRA